MKSTPRYEHKWPTFALMPMVYYQSLHHAEVGVWGIEEPERFFYDALAEMDFPVEVGQAIAHPEKRLQWFASRYLLSKLYPQAITLVDGRKPYLFNGPQVSISHSRNMVAVMLGETLAGIDLQWPDPKLKKVAPRFTSQAELEQLSLGSELEALTAVWAIKEAVFKHYGTALPFRQIEIESFDPHSSLATTNVHRNGQSVVYTVNVQWFDKTVITFLCEKLPLKTGML